MSRTALVRILTSVAFLILLYVVIACYTSQYPLQMWIAKVSFHRNGSSDHQPNIMSTVCRPRESILLAKTHKTAGSTLGTIIARYGYERNLAFALPNGYILGYDLFSVDMLLQKPPPRGFDVLINHVRFRKSTMAEIMNPHTKYVTIVREPVSRWYSTVEYYSLWKRGYSKEEYEERAETFNIDDFLAKISNCNSFRCRLGRDGQLFDLGFTERSPEGTDVSVVRTKIGQLQEEFDLVLVAEYFDESLLLLRKLMCWDFRDIVYLRKKQSKKNRKKPSGEAEAIRNWNQGDVLLYEHFNITLWEKIEEYGPDFEKDLRYFRKLNARVAMVCGDPSLPSARTIWADIFSGYEGLGLEDVCGNLRRDIRPYTNLLRKLAFQDGRLLQK